MIGMVSASVLTGEHVRFALVEHDLRPVDGLVCPVDDRRCTEAEALCRAQGWPFHTIESVHNGNGLGQLLDCEAVIVITTGDDYACAEIVRRAEAAGLKVFVRTVEWEQQTLC